MQFETAKEAALRLGVTARAVQKWAKEGKIPGASLHGNSWMIPKDFCPVGHNATKSVTDNLKSPESLFHFSAVVLNPGRQKTLQRTFPTKTTEQLLSQNTIITPEMWTKLLNC